MFRVLLLIILSFFSVNSLAIINEKLVIDGKTYPVKFNTYNLNEFNISSSNFIKPDDDTKISNKNIIDSFRLNIGSNLKNKEYFVIRDISELYFLSIKNNKEYQEFTVFLTGGFDYNIEIWYFIYDKTGKFIDKEILAYNGGNDMKAIGKFIKPNIYEYTESWYNEYADERGLPEWGSEITEYRINDKTGKIKRIITKKREVEDGKL